MDLVNNGNVFRKQCYEISHHDPSHHIFGDWAVKRWTTQVKQGNG